MSHATDLIRQFNAGRDPELLARKFSKMRTDPFVFLRGSCHLFYERLDERLAQADICDKPPVTWLCGDLHLENFGCYKGSDRHVCFDINDFDEALLGPCTLDLVRVLASLRMAAGCMGSKKTEASDLCQIFVDAYRKALAYAQARRIDAGTGKGPVQDLLLSMQKRKRVDFLDSRTERIGKSRRIRLDGHKALPLDDVPRAAVEQFMNDFARSTSDPQFFHMLDAARRIAGIGSLGLERYIILVEGKGLPDGNYLLELKRALPSSLARHVREKQPEWTSHAERVVIAQQRMQAVPRAFLNAVQFAADTYVLRELQPSEDRIEVSGWNGKSQRMEIYIRTIGQLMAWAQLRSAAQGGSASLDVLVAFGQRDDWQRPVLEFSAQCAATVQRDWQDFSIDYDKGAFH